MCAGCQPLQKLLQLDTDCVLVVLWRCATGGNPTRAPDNAVSVSPTVGPTAAPAPRPPTHASSLTPPLPAGRPHPTAAPSRPPGGSAPQCRLRQPRRRPPSTLPPAHLTCWTLDLSSLRSPVTTEMAELTDSDRLLGPPPGAHCHGSVIIVDSSSDADDCCAL